MIDTGFSSIDLGMHQQSNYTAAAWINFTQPVGDNHVFSQTNAANNIMHLGVRNRRAHLGHWGNDTQGASTLATGVWHHVVWRYRDGAQSIFVDGVEDGGPVAQGQLNNANRVVIGNSGRNDWGFQGAMDEVMVFTNALSYGQIGYLADGGDPFNLPLESPLEDGDFFTAPHGPGDTWNLYQVVGLDEGGPATWIDAENRASATVDPSGLTAVAGHLVSLHSREETFTIGRMSDFAVTWIGLTDDHTVFGGTEAGGNRKRWMGMDLRRIVQLPGLGRRRAQRRGSQRRRCGATARRRAVE